MFPNLNAEISRKGIKKRDLAKTLEVFETTVYRKLNGVIPLTLKECKAIRDVHFPGMKIEYLFAEEGEEIAANNNTVDYQHS